MGKKKAKPVKPDSHTSNPKSKKKSLKKSLKKSKGLAFVQIIDTLLPALPLIDGESDVDYEAFYKSCLRAVRPRGAIEKIWLKDFIDYAWESRRLRRMKVRLIQATRRRAVETLLNDYADSKDFGGNWGFSFLEKLSKAWSRSDSGIVGAVEAFFEKHNVGPDTIMATAISLKLDDLERIDKMIASYDYRRDAAIRELEKRRDLLAKRAREFTDAIITEVDVEKLEAAE